MIVLENAHIHPVTKNSFTGNLAIEDGKIIEVSTDPIKASLKETIDCRGQHITPGFIDSHTHQGLFQGDIGWAGMDGNEMTDPVTPHLRSLDAINPEDPGLVEAPSGGITAINTGPGSANVIGGLFSIIKTHGTIIDKMIIKDPSCIKVALGENPKGVYGKKDKFPQTRMAIAALLRENLHKARDYLEKKKKRDPEAKEKTDVEYDMKLEALSLALERKIPIHAHCHRADDIVTAIRIAEEFNVKLVLIHATEGHKIADFIASKGVPVSVGPSFVGREKVELREISFATPGILAKAGVSVCLQSDTFPPLRYFHSIFCMAIKEGMQRGEALKAVTVNPAKVLGIDDRTGSLTPGMDADLAVWNGDPYDFYNRVVMTFIDGKMVYKKE